MKKRNDRQQAIRQIVREHTVKTQQELVTYLQLAGYDCTQATVSRDVSELGVRKLGDATYILAEDMHLSRMAEDLVEYLTLVNNMVIIKTQPGTGPGVAAALDAAELPGVAGSISGDDTILIICATPELASRFVDQFESCCGRQFARRDS